MCIICWYFDSYLEVFNQISLSIIHNLKLNNKFLIKKRILNLFSCMIFFTHVLYIKRQYHI